MTRAIVFAYSEVGVRCVRELLVQGVDIALLFTHADDPRESQWFGSVWTLARAHGLRVVAPEDPNTAEWIAEGRKVNAEFVFSFYYRFLLTPEWLGVPTRGALNMHGSLLPKYRGRAPVHWAIIGGETSTGASLHYMLEKPDAGALVDQMSVPILENDTALDVSVKVADAAERVLRRSLPKLIAGTADARLMDLTTGSYFGRRRPEDGQIDWHQPARVIHDLVRAVAPPFPGAFTRVNGYRLEVLETRMDDDPPRHGDSAPCLYADRGTWFADCVDSRRLRILKLLLGDATIEANAPPPFLSNQPVAL